MSTKQSQKSSAPGLVTASYIITIDVIGKTKHHPLDDEPSGDEEL